MQNSTEGFTLIELLLAIGIISILATVLLPNLLQVRQKTNDVAADAVGRQVLNAMAATEASNIAGTLPSCLYGNAEVSVSAGSEIINVKAPLPLTDVSCENILSSPTAPAQYKVSVSYKGGTAMSKAYSSSK
ncbi:type II secretion system protein [Deinococcus oregonensis]|uniref:Type II secretion system protein n=1 Tax=Deinococcus oregonensis TaxID=1805970 RepID=A0ABV6AUG3_9DEIO